MATCGPRSGSLSVGRQGVACGLVEATGQRADAGAHLRDEQGNAVANPV